MSRSLTLLLFSLLLTACAAAVEATPTALPSPSPSPTPRVYEVEVIDPVEFLSGEDRLVGRLYLPLSQEAVPAVVMVHGSGRRTRVEAANMAMELAEKGIAVFRYDKRGVGDSEGRYSEVGNSNSEQMLPVLASDVVAAVEFIQGRAEINAEQVGVLGNSQGGWIIPIAVGQSEEIAFAVLLVGPAVSVGEQNYYSGLTRRSAANTTPEQLDEYSAALAAYEPIGFDPREAIATMQVPALWVLGGRDESVPTRETTTILERIRAEYGREFTIHIYPDGTHGLRHAETGEAFDFLGEVVLDWIFSALN